jgi:hypothetical protein
MTDSTLAITSDPGFQSGDFVYIDPMELGLMPMRGGVVRVDAKRMLLQKPRFMGFIVQRHPSLDALRAFDLAVLVKAIKSNGSPGIFLVAPHALHLTPGEAVVAETARLTVVYSDLEAWAADPRNQPDFIDRPGKPPIQPAQPQARTTYSEHLTPLTSEHGKAALAALNAARGVAPAPVEPDPYRDNDTPTARVNRLRGLTPATLDADDIAEIEAAQAAAQAQAQAQATGDPGPEIPDDFDSPPEETPNNDEPDR